MLMLQMSVIVLLVLLAVITSGDETRLQLERSRDAGSSDGDAGSGIAYANSELLRDFFSPKLQTRRAERAFGNLPYAGSLENGYPLDQNPEEISTHRFPTTLENSGIDTGNGQLLNYPRPPKDPPEPPHSNPK